MSFTAIDLFAGIGGFRIAAERNGGHCIAFSEIAPDAIQTYLANHPESQGTNLGDITALSSLPPHDLLMGGVPCQSWSIAGRNLGFDDDRGQLWNDALFLLNQARPKAFLFENVKGLSDPRNKNELTYILRRIQEAGYQAAPFVLNAFDYGVPQSRVRIYIIGFRESHFFNQFRLPSLAQRKLLLKDVMDDTVDPSRRTHSTIPSASSSLYVLNHQAEIRKARTTSLSSNNNGFNDYFLFNDLRNGLTTIHSWDIISTTKRQKEICLLLLRNRRKKDYGLLDGNPLALAHFQSLDKSVTQSDLDGLVELGILKPECYSYRVMTNSEKDLTDQERVFLTHCEGDCFVPDTLSCNKAIKINKIPIASVLKTLEQKGRIESREIRYDFRYTKISTGLFGVNRIFLPSSNIFPTLVASDTNDFLTPISIDAPDIKTYREMFINQILKPKNFRRVSKNEACRIQGFPEDFLLPESRPRWMKLLGNSVSVPVVEQLISAICQTGVFSDATDKFPLPSESDHASCKLSTLSYDDSPLSEREKPVQMVLFENNRSNPNLEKSRVGTEDSDEDAETISSEDPQT